jgi:hypothetical protein
MASRLTSLHHRPLKSQPSIPLTQCVKQNDQSRFFRLLVLPQISSVSKDRGRRPQRQAAAERISPRLSLRSHWHEASDLPQHSEMRLDVLTVEECSHNRWQHPYDRVSWICSWAGGERVRLCYHRRQSRPVSLRLFWPPMDWARGVHLLRELLERLGPPRLLRLLDTLVRPIEQAGSVR